MKNERRFYVYVHRRKTDGRIFYVGKGNGYRCSTTNGRNKYWHRVAKKHGWTWEKPYQNLTESCAHMIEKMLIYALRHQLTNVTDGGEGVCGLVHTEETKRKMVANRKPGWIPHLAGKKMPQETKDKLRIAHLGKRQSPEHAAKSRVSKLGKSQPQSARDFISKLKSKPVISSNGEIFPSATEAARALSIRLGLSCSQGNISMVANGLRENAYGLSWSYDVTTTPCFCPTKYREKSIICNENGMVFHSVQAAKEWVISWRGSAHNQCISQSARDGGSAYGFHWRYT